MSALKINENTFKTEVLNSDLPVLVDFAAEWCGPCKMMAPILDEVASEMKGKLKVATINVDDSQELAAQYNVMSIPSLFIFKKGKVVDQMVGAMGKEHLLSRITPYV